MTAASNFGLGPSTPTKLARVMKIIPWVVRMAAPHVKRYGGHFWYIDANAGPALYRGAGGEALEGSPLLALQTLRDLEVPYTAILIDDDPAIVARLRASLMERGFLEGRHYMVECADNRVVLPRVCAQADGRYDRGLLFLDPKGSPHFEDYVPALALPQVTGIDVLWNVPTNTLKMERRAATSARFSSKPGWMRRDVRPLYERLPLFHKSRFLIGEPTKDKLAWSLILGSNWSRFPEWRAGQLDASDGEVGNERLVRISLTKRERRERGWG